MRTPRVGVTTYGEHARWGVWGESAHVLHASYALAIRSAGAAPLLLAPGGSPDEALAVVTVLDGLVLSGGADIDPRHYGAQRHPKTGPPRPDRDLCELALLSRALELGLPVLAICRGMQLLNVALGGTLTQHLPDLVGHDEHCAAVGVVGRHTVSFSPDSRVARMMGDFANVSAYHHQGIDRLGSGLTAVGWAADQTVEAVELDGAGWVVGVQWHPEVDGLGTLFSTFVQACASTGAENQTVPVPVPVWGDA